MTPKPETTGNGKASQASGWNACDCGLASSGSPPPASGFHSGQRPAPYASRTRVSQGAICSTRSLCRRFPGGSPSTRWVKGGTSVR